MAVEIGDPSVERTVARTSGPPERNADPARSREVPGGREPTEGGESAIRELGAEASSAPGTGRDGERQGSLANGVTGYLLMACSFIWVVAGLLSSC